MQFPVYHVVLWFISSGLLCAFTLSCAAIYETCSHTSVLDLVLVVDKTNKSGRCWVTKPGIQKRRERGIKFDFVLFLFGLSSFFSAMLRRFVFIGLNVCDCSNGMSY